MESIEAVSPQMFWMLRIKGGLWPCWVLCQISPQSLDSWNLALTHSLPKVSELGSSFSVRHVLPISNYHSTIFPHPWLQKAFLYTNKYAVTLKSL